MKHLLLLAALAGSVLSAAAQTQDIDTYANEGLRADGYIDFADMPAAPVFPPPPSNISAPFTATLPVHGVPGLTVQVNISSLTSNFSEPSGLPIYQTSPGTINFNGSGSLQLHFSAGIQGVSVESEEYGRGAAFSLDVGTNAIPTLFGSSVTTTELDLFPRQYPLQVVDQSGPLQDVSVPLPLNFYNAVPTLSNLRVQSAGAAAYAESQVATNGLQLWFRSEDINPGPGVAWPDHSGHGRNATVGQVNAVRPSISMDGIAHQPAYVFARAENVLNFNLPISGWTEMTVFLVASSDVDSSSYASDNAAIFWTEDARWGNTFVSPYQTHAAFRFGTTQVNNQPVYTRPNNVGQDFTVTRAVHNQTTDALYVNGVPVLSQEGKYASLNGTTGAATIGLGLNGTPFKGEVSEVLVYNRVLTEAEAAKVELYLRTKFRTP